MQDLLRTLRAKKSELDDWTKDLTTDLAGLPHIVKQAEDHAATLQQQALSQEGYALLISMCDRLFNMY